MEQRLVVGVDGSAQSLRALDWAVDEAALHTMPLHILHVAEEEQPLPAHGNSDLPLSRVVARHVITQAADRAHARQPCVPVTADSVQGAVIPMLLEHGTGAAALVVGSRGRGGFTGLLLGSVSQSLAAHAKVPVVVFRGPAPGDGTADHRRIVVGASGSEASEAAVGFALREAALRGAPVTAVHAWRMSRTPAAVAGGLPHDHLRQDEVFAEQVLDFAVGAAVDAAPGVRIERLAVEGSPRAALLRAAAGAGLVVLGARRRAGLLGLRLGPVNHALLHHARCPVAIVPEA